MIPPACHTVCYADDTLVMGGGSSWEKAIERANLAVARVVRQIKQLGLRVAPQKTEAIFLHDGSHGAPPKSHITIEDIPIEVGAYIKYLGLHLDGRWVFREHFRQISQGREGSHSFTAPAAQPGGTRRECSTVRRNCPLDTSVRSVWEKSLVAARGPRNALRQVQRRVANRECRGYHTVS